MAKILLPLNNTVWGVIINPQSSNSYREILSFKNDKIKTEFIGKYLFNDINFNYKKALNDENFQHALFQTSSTTATVIVDLKVMNLNKQNLKYTIDDVLNVDFLISEEYGRYKFWAVNEVIKNSNQNTFTINLEIDIFFTYDIKNIFNNNLMEINTAHYNRFTKIKDKIYPVLDYNSPNNTIELFEGNIGENNYEPVKYKPLEVEFNQYQITNRDKDILKYWDEKKQTEFVKNWLNKQNWLIGYMVNNSISNVENNEKNIDNLPEYSLNAGTSRAWLEEHVSQQNLEEPEIKYPYYIFVAPTSPAWLSFYNNPSTTELTKIKISANNLYDYIKSNTLHYSNSTTISSTIPFNNTLSKLSGTTLSIMMDLKPSHSSDYSDINNYTVNFMYLEHIENFTYYKLAETTKPVINNKNNNYGFINKVQLSPSMLKSKEYDLLFDDFPNLSKWLPHYSSPSNFLAETKAYKSPYIKWEISGANKGSYDIMPELTSDSIINNKTHFLIDFAFLPEVWKTLIKPNTGIYKKANIKYNLTLDSPANFTLPDDNKKFNEFIQTNQSQQTLGWINGGINTVKGVVGGAIAGGMTAGPIGALAGGVVGALAGAIGIGQQLATRQDIKRTPDKVSSNGSTLGNEYVLKNLNYILTKKRLYKIDWLKIAQHFTSYGVNYANNLYNINKLINTRYYYNYIQAPSVFENIEIRLSAGIKQIINDSLKDGVRIWHVRDLNTFKGVKNFDYDNTEMEIIDE